MLMKIFIIHRGDDYNKVEELKEQIEKLVKVDLLSLSSDPDNKHWFKEAKLKINQSDLILYALGRTTHESKNVDKEIKYSMKKKKQILLFRLNPDEKCIINHTLFKKDEYNNVDKPLFKEILLQDLARIIKYGYNFDIQNKLNETKDPKRENELIEQYKAYLSTSEEVLTRRQNTSNFYTTLNTSMLTLAVTIAGILFGVSQINSILIVSLILFVVSVIGILLNINWSNLLESYGRLNGAKMRVISEMEKNLPANIYDTEWKVMSEKLYDGKYVSFTSIEKRLPISFIVLFGILLVASIVLFYISFFIT